VKRLYVLRHAKSSWDEPGLDDHDRPLAPRGRSAATRIAAHMTAAGIRPSLVLCSSARRTRQTLGLLCDALEGRVEVRIEPGLYGTGVDELLEVLRGVPGRVPSVLLIGHNPAVQQLALTLTGKGDQDLVDSLTEKMPTAALASLEFATDHWAEIGPGDGELVGFVVPRAL
jgi:phosphohistidine phosphatase